MSVERHVPGALPRANDVQVELVPQVLEEVDHGVVFKLNTFKMPSKSKWLICCEWCCSAVLFFSGTATGEKQHY